MRVTNQYLPTPPPFQHLTIEFLIVNKVLIALPCIDVSIYRSPRLHKHLQVISLSQSYLPQIFAQWPRIPPSTSWSYLSTPDSARLWSCSERLLYKHTRYAHNLLRTGSISTTKATLIDALLTTQILAGHDIASAYSWSASKSTRSPTNCS